MAEDTRYYVRNSDDFVEDKRYHDFGVDNPPDWTGVGTTHRVEPPPGGVKVNEHLEYKITGGAWVQKDQPDLDAMQLARDQQARSGEMTDLEHRRSAAQAIVDNPGSYSQAVRDQQAVCVSDCTSKLATHNTEFGNLWVRGSNP